MKGKIALVTGGMGGIGAAICQQLAKSQVRVIASYNRSGDHEAAIQWQIEQKKQGYDIDINFVDVADYDSCLKMIQALEAKYQTIDILVNNAGIARDTQFYKMDVKQWQAVLQTNLDSMFNVTHHVIKGMMSRGFGRIINISSINGQKGQFGQTNYAAAKAGIIGFTKSLAQEVARKGITVNAIAPGYIATPMVMSMPEKVRENIVAQIPVGRLGTPEEIARAVCFLASESSGFITGSTLSINGGQYLA